MIDKDILEADMLDILFEHRNKAYGAYSLRRHYNNRLSIALGVALSSVALFYFTSLLRQNSKVSSGIPDSDKSAVIIRSIEIEAPKNPGLPVVKEHVRNAEVRDAGIKIVPNDQADEVPDQTELASKIISTATVDGTIPEDPNAPAITRTDSEKQGKEMIETKTDFNPVEISPSFPGGPAALALFFSKTLSSPVDLEAGEKKVVLVKFIVGADGSVTRAEIIQSGGDIYDREVLRAFKRMPRWNPAIQNGNKVAVSFTQPVTFVGVEQ